MRLRSHSFSGGAIRPFTRKSAGETRDLILAASSQFSLGSMGCRRIESLHRATPERAQSGAGSGRLRFRNSRNPIPALVHLPDECSATVVSYGGERGRKS